MDVHLKCGRLATPRKPIVTLKRVNMTKRRSSISSYLGSIHATLSLTLAWGKCGLKKTLLYAQADFWPPRSSTMRKTSQAVFALLAHMRGSDNRRRRGKSYNWF